MHRFESQESQPLRRRSEVDEGVVEIRASAALWDQWGRRLEPWNFLLLFAIQFAVLRANTRPETPLWVHWPIIVVGLFFFATFRFNLARRLGARLPGAKRRAEQREREAARSLIRLNRSGVQVEVQEKVRRSIAWSEIERVVARRGVLIGAVLHLRSGKRVTLNSIGFTDTPETLAEIVESARRRYGGL